MNDVQPPSIRQKTGDAVGTDEPDGFEPSLLRLHTALKELDAAVHTALVALDVALGRPVRAEPPKALPIRELGRLRLHLQTARGEAGGTPERSIADIADCSEHTTPDSTQAPEND